MGSLIATLAAAFIFTQESQTTEGIVECFNPCSPFPITRPKTTVREKEENQDGTATQ